MSFSVVDPIAPNLELLRATLELVERLSDGQYTHVETRLTAASIGAHVRHVLDHYRLFLAGLPEGEVDYDDRQRDTDIERSALAAATEARRLIAAFAALGAPATAAVPGAGAAGAACAARTGRLAADWAARPLRVRQQGDDEPGRFDGCDSHAERELLFLASHAVHHQALIAMLVRAQGLAVPESFGLAPSTATWQRANAAHENTACAR
jgi:uncharacterized damage-inducible protein DinB